MYYDFSELDINRKEIAIAVLICVAVLVVCFFAGYLCGIRNVSDNGSGTEPIGKELEQVGTNISDAKEGIKEAAGTADKIGSGIKDAKDTAGYIQSTADTSAELISECQSIIAGIRARGKAAKTKD